MPTNEFLPFASGTDPNVMPQATYAASSFRTGGVIAGVASSALANKSWRQSANMAAAWGSIVAQLGFDAFDDGDVATLASNILNALAARFSSVGPRNAAVYSAAGVYSWIVPAGITLISVEVWGAGGGGGGVGSGGGGATGGAGGGYAEGVLGVSPGASVAVAVGAGGTAGTGSGNGGTGGTSSVGGAISATGGGGGAGASGGGTGAQNTSVGAGSGGYLQIFGAPSAAGMNIAGQLIGSPGGGSFKQAVIGGLGIALPLGPSFPGGGGGGGGGASANNGNAGSPGLVIIRW